MDEVHIKKHAYSIRQARGYIPHRRECGEGVVKGSPPFPHAIKIFPEKKIRKFLYLCKINFWNMTKFVNFHDSSVTIYDSWRFKDYATIGAIIDWVKSSPRLPECMRCIGREAMIREVMAHNMLYELGYKTDRTKDTDLDCEPKHRRVAYFVLSAIYRAKNHVYEMIK